MGSHGTENSEWNGTAFATLCSGVEPSMNCVETWKLSSMVGGGELGTSGNELVGIWVTYYLLHLRQGKDGEMGNLSFMCKYFPFTAMERMYTYDVTQRERRKM